MEVEPQNQSQIVVDNSLAAEINKRNYTPYIIGLVVVIVLAAIGGFWYTRSKKVAEPVACTMEAMICPDGSSVGRTGPNCEFAPCPKVLTGLEKDLKNLNINESGLKQESKTTIPKTFSGEWLAREKNCSQGGYDIKPYAGQEVIMRRYETAESYQGKPLDLWAIIKGDKLICAYKVVRAGSSASSGTFPIISK